MYHELIIPGKKNMIISVDEKIIFIFSLFSNDITHTKKKKKHETGLKVIYPAFYPETARNLS